MEEIEIDGKVYVMVEGPHPDDDDCCKGCVAEADGQIELCLAFGATCSTGKTSHCVWNLKV